MIRRLIAGVLLACFAASTQAADEAEIQTKMNWKLPVLGKTEPGKLYKLKVPNPIYDTSRSFPSDLRILDAQGEQWPFFVWIPRSKIDTVNRSFEVLNTVKVDEPEPYVRQDLKLRPDPGTKGRVRHNQVAVYTPGRDFVRRIEIFAGEDQETWGLLAKGFLIDFAKDAKAKNRVIRYPKSDYPFLQVRVYPNAREALEQYGIERVLVNDTARKSGEIEPVPLQSVPVDKKELKEGCQVLHLDTGARSRPLSRLYLDIEEKEYVRSLKAYGRNAETNRWRWVADGQIHRIGGQVAENLALPNFNYRYLKLEVFHYDDDPLTVTGVTAEAVPRYIVFEAKDGKDPVLYYGSKDVKPPRYDLKRRKGESDIRTALLLELGRAEANQDFQLRGYGPWGPRLATLAVALVSLLVLWVVIRMLREQSARKT